MTDADEPTVAGRSHSIQVVREGLADLGLAVVDLDYVEDQPALSTVLTGSSADGTPVVVSVLGRDTWTSRRWTRLWHFAW